MLGREMKGLNVIPAFVRSTPREANLIGGLTLIVWLLKAIFLDGITAPYAWMAGIGTVVDGLFSAVIAGYVFYVLFALWPDYQARRTLAPYVNGKVRRIVGDCQGVLDMINQATSRNIAFAAATEAEIVEGFAAVRTSDPPNIQNGSRRASWFEFLQYRHQRTLEATNSLMDRVRFLEVDLVSVLSGIEECSYFNMVAMTAGIPVNNPDLSAWASSFIDYQARIQVLARWHDEHILPDGNPLM